MRQSENVDRVKKITQGIPREKLVYRYDASIIIEFLTRTFMPLPYFVKPEYLHTNELVNGMVYGQKRLYNDPEFVECHLPMDTLYEYYLLYREKVPYSRQVESRYQFSVIIRRMSYERNGWKFYVRRYSRDQTLIVGPLKLRVQVPPEVRDIYIFDSPGPKVSEETIVEAPLQDMQEDVVEDPTLEP